MVVGFNAQIAAATPNTTRCSARSWTATGTLRPTWRSRWGGQRRRADGVTDELATESGAGTPIRSAAARRWGLGSELAHYIDFFDRPCVRQRTHGDVVEDHQSGGRQLRHQSVVASRFEQRARTAVDLSQHRLRLHQLLRRDARGQPNGDRPDRLDLARGWQQDTVPSATRPIHPPRPVNQQQPSAGKVPVAATARVAAVAASGAATDVGAPTVDLLSRLRVTRRLAALAVAHALRGRRRWTQVRRSPRTWSTSAASRRHRAADDAVHALRCLSGASRVADRLRARSDSRAGDRRAGGALRWRGDRQGHRPWPPARDRRRATPEPRTRSLLVRWNSHDRSKARRTVFIAVSTTRRRYTTVWEGFDHGRAMIPLAELPGAGGSARVAVTDGFRSAWRRRGRSAQGASGQRAPLQRGPG